MGDAFIPKLKTGDVVIQEKPGVALCAWGAVITDGMLPNFSQSGTGAQATEWAEQFLATTKGTLYRMTTPSN